MVTESPNVPEATTPTSAGATGKDKVKHEQQFAGLKYLSNISINLSRLNYGSDFHPPYIDFGVD